MDLTQVWNHSDQILVVEDKQLHVHRCLLSLWSPVFDRMFHSDFVEKNSDSVTLHGKNYGEVKEMLEIMYDRRKQVTEDNVHYLLQLADEYQMDQLQTECVKHIQRADKTGLNAIKYLDLGRKFHLTDIEEECLNELQKLNNNQVTSNENYQQLDDSAKLAIITACAKHQSETLEAYKNVLHPFIEYILNRAFEGYLAYLRKQGLDEGIFSKCDRREKHTLKKMGQNFDYTCELCRNRLTVIRKFEVNTQETCDKIERLLKLTSETKKPKTLY